MKKLVLSRKFRNNYYRNIPGGSTFSKVEYFNDYDVPFALSKCKDAKVHDVDKNEYIDYILANGSVTLGHNNKLVNKAIINQLKNGISFSLPTKLEIEVSELLKKHIPSAEMVRFGKNGNDATTAAIRLARYYTGEKNILFCGYHSWQDWYIGKSSKNGGVPKEVSKLSHRFTYGNIESIDNLLKKLKNKIACIIIDPLPGLESKPNIKFLKYLERICKKNNIIYIFDEVVTGFRCLNKSVQSNTGVMPDLSAFSKGIANGMPISALVGKKKIMKKFSEIFYSLTFAGETLSLAAAKEVLTIHEKIDVTGYIDNQGLKLRNGMNDLIYKNKLNEKLKIFGSNSRLVIKPHENYKNIKINFPQEWTKIVCKFGILNFGVSMISLKHNDKIINQTLNKYKDIFSNINKIL